MLKTKQMFSRQGLSIIEVLTSIVVAMIGVFGVMILIPFAVKMAQTGLDSDAGVQVARNAYSQFEISGCRNPANWYDPTPIPEPEVFSIDPLGITENGDDYTAFPQNPSTPVPAQVAIRSVNLRDPTGSAFGIELARRMFRTSDDLVFGEALDDLRGPEQLFDFDGGNRLRRQSVGRISWSAIVVPVKNESVSTAPPTKPWSYKMYILVYKNRKTLIGDPDGAMAISSVDLSDPSRIGVKSPLGNIYLAGGVQVEGGVNRDDWVMLINSIPLAEDGFDRQIAFCRVISLSDGTPASLTLDGPDFDFGNPERDTYVVHLKDVIGVYERTFEPENASNWNVSF